MKVVCVELKRFKSTIVPLVIKKKELYGDACQTKESELE